MMPSFETSEEANEAFNAEAIRLYAACGLDGSKDLSKIRDMDPIWQHPKTGAVIYVGNEVAARGPASVLQANGITHVVVRRPRAVLAQRPHVATSPLFAPALLSHCL